MWPAYVINLSANTARMAESARQLDAQGITWRRIDGINGWDLEAAEVARVYDAARNARAAKHPLVAPEIGCYLSHVAAWRAIAAADAPGGFIFEDDFAARPSLAAVLALLSDDRSRWDMAKLFAFEPLPRLIAARPLGPHHRIGIAYRVPTCLLGYALTRAAAGKLATRAIPFFRPVDEDQKFFWETGLRVALVTPPPLAVGNQEAATGTIGEVRRRAARARGGGRNILAQTWAALAYQTGYLARLHLSRLRGIGQ